MPAAPARKASARRDAPGSARSRLFAIAPLTIPVLLVAVQAWRRRWLCDDAFIDFRVVANWIAGHGPVFNVGERVEAYTNPAWVALLALWSRLGGPLERGAVSLGWILACIGLVAAQGGAVGLARRAWRIDATRSARLLPAGALVVAVLPPVWDFATSGLESSLAWAWLGVSFWILVRALDWDARAVDGDARGRWLGAALLLGIGPLVRPDLALEALAFVLALLVVRGSRAAPKARRGLPLPSLRAGAAIVVCFLILPLAYQLFRMGYFAGLVSNSALAKEAGAAQWERGRAYLADFTGTYWIWIPILLLLPVWLFETRALMRRRDLAALGIAVAPVIGGVLHAIFVVRVGGDFMHARLLLPALWSLLLPVMALLVPGGLGGRRKLVVLAGGAALLAWAVVCGLALRVYYGPRGIGGRGLADERAYYVHEANRAHPIMPADFGRLSMDGLRLRQLASAHMEIQGRNRSAEQIRKGPRALLIDKSDSPVDQRPEPGEASAYSLVESTPAAVQLVVGRWNIGITAYLAGPTVHVIDRYGLADPLAGRLHVAQVKRPGHSKLLANAWIVARFAKPDAGADTRAVDAARRALSCPQLADLVAAVTEPLDAHRFWRNVRVAPRLHRLRIPPEPEAAARECGSTNR